MIFKKPTFALCSSLPALLPSSHPCYSITSSSCSTNTRWPPCQEHGHVFLRRQYYATVFDGSKKSATSSNEHAWPESPHPTPYEIFDQQKSAPYSKTKFYELVKLYHPDRHHHVPTHRLSHSARLERYRLVVAANQILSDPSKRRAYDLYGAGWGGMRNMENLYRSADRSWRDVPGNPSMNATWEDWERWYNERDGKKEKQSPVYMSNQLFAGVLCIFVVIGSVGQARRANSNTTNLVEMREQSHAIISHDMRQRQTEQATLNRHERVENFLRQREGWALAATEIPRSVSASDEK
ncbi:J domain-containing protein 1 [Daldinia childiae]|uniref:J domain-containing protein 1 n=1 Tax=Daldinia childiae TaxID=326645 RepID=UPI0014462672|nr:J domain-containing protein 1 [Daldinia childiae]KAF3060065.1 J domain-containing protein 1 [Daldinia childiae]